MIQKIITTIACSFILLFVNAQSAIPSADDVVKTATAQASKENKNVFVMFHASWCIWCKRLDAYLADPRIKDAIEKNYVITHITVQEDPAHKSDENPGGRDYLFANGGSGTGVPYWLIVDKSGKTIANSRLKGDGESLTGTNGDNTGCPGAGEELDYFLRVLKATSKLSDAELTQVSNVFSKK